MRWILAALVLVNVGFFMWGSWYKGADQPQQPMARAPINPEKLRLISDPTVKATLRLRRQRAAVKILQPVKRICRTVGPFETNRSAVGAGVRMKKAGLEYSLRTIETVEKRYQLYIPPRKSRKSAQAMQRKLSRLGFRDNALMFDKRVRNAISVGLFKIEANAIQLRKNLRKKGIRVRQRVLVSKSRRFWLDVPTDEAKLVRLKAVKWREKEVAVKETTCARASVPARAK